MELAERFLLDALAYLECALGVLFSVLLEVVGLPYGRYTSPGSAWQLSATTAWVVQELPSLVVPLFVCVATAAERLRRWPNRVLLAMFVVHYIHRSLIFPFLIRGGKPTSWYVCVMAFVFCTYNGYLQSRYLSHYAVYADDWVTDPRFLAGFVLWLTGMLINIHSDGILRNLRQPGQTGRPVRVREHSQLLWGGAGVVWLRPGQLVRPGCGFRPVHLLCPALQSEAASPVVP
ncbi:3-oxo-5-alpha-steroid 4-dehydrogenase 1 isoform X2 [Pteropus alecto]|uniref:3-oxo-5-alpha-steroid 4-dehydrogenase 1 isoform X2 n=1 Tax=Pteropus alecto TaxID=9402 RepID=UPI000D53A4BF|nr:3-oxo-5-alpha-steroid 4-dehydrogenase 1 isoform X2 [Pteropus alecto]